MFAARLATIAIIAGLTTAFLAGCSTTASSQSDASTTKAPSSSAVVRTPPEQRKVTVVKVVDPKTVVVTPVTTSDTLSGKDFTVHIDQLQAPSKNECGYAQSVAYAESVLKAGSTWSLLYPKTTDSVYIDANGDQHGYLSALNGDFGQSMIQAGMATLAPTADVEYLSTAQTQAQSAKTGLWGTCPDFGA